MNRPTPHHLSCLIGAGVLSFAAFTASAQTISTVALDTAAQMVDAEATPPTAVEAQLAAQRDADRDCMRHTGTRIIPRDKSGKRCIAEHGSVYTREDLDRTGETD